MASPTAVQVGAPLPGDLPRTSDDVHLVVLQPTTLCNLDCVYCYLPLRKTRNEMAPAVAEAVAAGIAAQSGGPEEVGVLWHGGEPLAIGRAKFAELLAPFEPLRRAGRITHHLQTNATLIDEPWAALLAEYGFRVGVSVDGPGEMNRNRLNMAGKPTYAQTMRGVERLRAAGIAPHVLCVVTDDVLARPFELLDALAADGFREVGINLEERDGVNLQRPLADLQAVRDFWRGVVAWQKSAPEPLNIREVAILARSLNDLDEPPRDVLPTVTWDGDVVLISPELAGLSAPQYNDFVVGNILRSSLQEILADRHRHAYVREFEEGLAACKATCSFWNACHGGWASNKYAERGAFNVTETHQCATVRQAVVCAVLDESDPVQDAELIETLRPLTERKTS